jgi:hypothetical protein
VERREINHDDDDDTDYISTGYQIDGQNYRLILTADEESQLLKLTLVSPIKVPKLRMKEATFVLNFLNLRSPVGKAVSPPGEGWTLDREASAR